MTSETFWESNDLERKAVEVLETVTYPKPDHHFGRPYLTAYQLAILIKERFPQTFKRSPHPLGGKNSAVSLSFTSYLAGQLSRKILSGEITDIEGGFLSNLKLKKIELRDGRESVTSSSTGSRALSMYRLRSAPA